MSEDRTSLSCANVGGRGEEARHLVGLHGNSPDAPAQHASREPRLEPGTTQASGAGPCSRAARCCVRPGAGTQGAGRTRSVCLTRPLVLPLVPVPLQLSGPFSALAEDSFSPCCPKVGGPKTPSMTGPEMQGEALSGARGCRPDCELSLGRTRSVWFGGQHCPCWPVSHSSRAGPVPSWG